MQVHFLLRPSRSARAFLELVCLALLAGAATARAQAGELPTEIVPRQWLVIAPVDAAGRRPFRPDAVFARYLLAHDAEPPAKDEALTGELGKSQVWREATAKEDAALDGEIAYAYTAIESPEERVMLAQLTGASRLFVNGAGFSGDAYGYGFGGVPIALKHGRNDLYVTGLRGSFHLKLGAVKDPLVFGAWDVTKPDLVAGAPATASPAGVLVMNATSSTLALRLRWGGGDELFQRGESPGSALGPLCLDKIPLLVQPARAAAKDSASLRFPLTVNDRDCSFDIQVKTQGVPHRITFISPVDASVQECSVLDAREPTDKIVLSLHGAGVDALGQAAAYSAKKDFALIAPTNRRPFGFDWQDWGRANAYEALAAGIAPLKPADVQVFLTGHSMGGHGTWHLAANDPDRFLAIAPSAGWASFDSYGGRPDGELRAMWRAAEGAGDTLSLIANLAQIPTFILHGTADDNVPVSEARAMEQALVERGAKPETYYKEGAGHWWDGDAAPGVDCVDWPGIFDLFRRAKSREASASLDFTTVDPSIDSRQAWIEVLQSLDYEKRVHVIAKLDESGALSLDTDNLRSFRITSRPPGWTSSECWVDAHKVDLSSWDSARAFVRTADGWAIDRAGGVAGSGEKRPDSSGPFKRAFDHGFVLVYGTRGTPEENRELFERARSDAAVWWYRGNGSAPLVSDVDLVAGRLPSRSMNATSNVILYGNADTNAAWKSMFGDRCPIQARRGSLKLGDREWKGGALGAVFVYPRNDLKDSQRGHSLAGAFADTGVAGSRLGYTLAPFVSGVGYPDFALFSADVLAKGDGGVLAAGWFDYDWNLDGREMVRRSTVTEGER